MSNFERFDNTVENYLKYRPTYPEAIYPFLVMECGLMSQHIIADIGSGTGFLAKIFLEHGHTVYGVEPNAGMRDAGEHYLSAYSNFHSIDGLAEATTLADESVNWITAGTAFHWFDAAKTREEFKRIITPGGFAVLAWNVRAIQQSALLRDYEQLLLQYCPNYAHSPAQEFDQTAVADFFAPYPMAVASFANSQDFDWEGLRGRLLSTSYSLRESDANYQDMMATLRIIFERYQCSGQVKFLYETRLYYGRMK